MRYRTLKSRILSNTFPPQTKMQKSDWGHQSPFSRKKNNWFSRKNGVWGPCQCHILMLNFQGPMLNISWKLSRLVRPADFRFYSQLKFCLQRSIWSIQVQHDFIKERKIDLIATNIKKIHYCQSCHRELFTFVWVKRKTDDINDKKRRAFCQVTGFLSRV